MAQVHVCSSDEEASQLIETVENNEGVRFVTRKSKNSKLTYVDDLKNFRILFEDVGRQSIPILFDGIPFIVLGTDVRECQFGHPRPKRKTITDGDECDLKHEQYMQNTKKISCKATIKLRRILKFPEYKIEGAAGRYKRKKIYEKIRERFCAVTEQEYVVLVQFDGKHSDHVIGKAAGCRNSLDKRITDKIKSLTKEGMLNVTAVAKRIKEFAHEIAPEGDKFNRRYCPSRKDVYNHIAYSLAHPRYHRDTKAAGEPVLQNSTTSMSKSAHLDDFGFNSNNDNTSRENAINHPVAEDKMSEQQVMLTPIKQEKDDAALYYDANLYESHLGQTTVDETAVLIPPNLHVNSSTANQVLVANKNWNPPAPSMLPSSRNLIFVTHNGATSSRLTTVNETVALIPPNPHVNSSTANHVLVASNNWNPNAQSMLPSSGNLIFATHNNGATSSQLTTVNETAALIPPNPHVNSSTANHVLVANNNWNPYAPSLLPSSGNLIFATNNNGATSSQLTTVDGAAELIPPNPHVNSSIANHVLVANNNLNPYAPSMLPSSGNLIFVTHKNRATSSQLTTVNETVGFIPPNPCVNSSTANHVLVANNNWNPSAPSMLPSSGNVIFVTPNNGATSSQLFLTNPGIQVLQPLVLLINGPQVDLHGQHSDTQPAVEPLVQNNTASMSKSTHLDNLGIVPKNENTSKENTINHNVAEDKMSEQQVMLTPIKQEKDDAALYYDANLYGSHLGRTTVDETAALIPPNLCVDSHKHNYMSVAQSNRNSDASSNPPSSGNLNFLTPLDGTTSSQPSLAHPEIKVEQLEVLLNNGSQLVPDSTMGKTHAEKQKAYRERKTPRRIGLPTERNRKGKTILQATGPQNHKTRRRGMIRNCIGKKRTQLRQAVLYSQI